MLNQLHTASDIAAEHHRALLAEAEAYRLTRTAGFARARRTPARHRARLRTLRALLQRMTGGPCGVTR